MKLLSVKLGQNMSKTDGILEALSSSVRVNLVISVLVNVLIMESAYSF